MAVKRRKKKSNARRPARKKRGGGPKIIPRQDITVVHPETGEEIKATIEIKPKIIQPGLG